MKKIIALTLLLALGAHAGEKGFEKIFNGKDLSGWAGPVQNYQAIDGTLRCKPGKGGTVYTKEVYGDFELRLDYKTVAKADSGIYLRGVPQVPIWDTTKAGGKWKIGADKGSGGLWNNSKGAKGKDPLVLADKPFGEWNSFRIRMVGEKVTVHLNGKLVVDNAKMENYFDRKGGMPKRGPIQLQTHGGEICWRNVFIKELN